MDQVQSDRAERPPTHAAAGERSGLAAVLWRETLAIHRAAEQSGIVRDILRGDVTRLAYGLLLRNLLPAYEQIEAGLERHAKLPGIERFATPALYRAEALRRDLGGLFGSSWRATLPLLGSAKRYADRVADVGRDDPLLLIAHAYVRYFGDLSGGQILKRVLLKGGELRPEALTFYDFPDIQDIAAFKESFREALNSVSPDPGEWARIAREAVRAFELNVAVSEEVKTRVAALPETAGLPAA